jgi:hypothetical protein
VDFKEFKNLVEMLSEQNYLKIREYFEKQYKAKALRYEIEVNDLYIAYSNSLQAFIS